MEQIKELEDLEKKYNEMQIYYGKQYALEQISTAQYNQLIGILNAAYKRLRAKIYLQKRLETFNERIKDLISGNNEPEQYYTKQTRYYFRNSRRKTRV